MAETKTKAVMDPVTAKMKRAFPNAELVKIKLDRHLGGDRKSVFVGVNGHIFQVPTGKVVEVSAPIAERLDMMKVQMEVLDDIRDGIPNESK